MNKKTTYTLWSVLFLLGIVGLFFHKTLIYGKLPVPTDTLVGLYHPWRDLYAANYPRGVPFKNFIITDPIRQQIPWRKQVIDGLKSGQMPGWNPYNYLGTSLKGNVQAAPFYPLNIFFFIMPFSWSWAFLIVLQPLMGGIFLYFFLRYRAISHPGAIFGAIVWAFSGFNISWLTWGTIGHVSAWLPLLMLSLDVFIKQDARFVNKSILGIVLSISMMIFAGHIQIALYCLVAGALYALWQIRHFVPPKKVKPIIHQLLGVMLISMAVTAFQWVPLIKAMMTTSRISGSVNALTEGWFLPLRHMIGFLVPDFFGNPATLNYWGVWNYGELTGYIGMVPILLSLLAIFTGSVHRFWILLVVGSLVFMIKNPLSLLLSGGSMPILGTLQPTRLMVICDFSLAVLSAYGFESLRSKSPRISRVLILVGILLCVVTLTVIYTIHSSTNSEILTHLAVSKRNIILPIILFGSFCVLMGIHRSLPRVRIYIPYILILITLFDLFRFGWKFTPFTPNSYFFPKTRIIEFLESKPKPFRVMTTDDRILPPNVASYFGIESADGYDPLTQSRFEQFLYTTESGVINAQGVLPYNRIYSLRNINSPLLPMWNVVYILTFEKIERDDFKLVASEGTTLVYEYTKALPRAFFAESIISVVDKTPKDVLAMTQLLSQVYRNAVVEKNIPVLSLPLASDEAVSIDSYGTNSIEFSTRTTNPRLLVVLNSFDPGWRASIDGNLPAQIVRVNYNFMGVIVPSGTHKVKLRYR